MSSIINAQIDEWKAKADAFDKIQEIWGCCESPLECYEERAQEREKIFDFWKGEDLDFDILEDHQTELEKSTEKADAFDKVIEIWGWEAEDDDEALTDYEERAREREEVFEFWHEHGLDFGVEDELEAYAHNEKGFKEEIAERKKTEKALCDGRDVLLEQLKKAMTENEKYQDPTESEKVMADKMREVSLDYEKEIQKLKKDKEVYADWVSRLGALFLKIKEESDEIAG